MIPEEVLKEIKKEANEMFPTMTFDDFAEAGFFNELHDYEVHDYVTTSERRSYIKGSTDMYERMEKQIESKDEEIKRLREALKNIFDGRYCNDSSFRLSDTEMAAIAKKVLANN